MWITSVGNVMREYFKRKGIEEATLDKIVKILDGNVSIEDIKQINQ